MVKDTSDVRVTLPSLPRYYVGQPSHGCCYEVGIYDRLDANPLLGGDMRVADVLDAETAEEWCAALNARAQA